jgi:putative ABC transport system substrate-binding protein
MSRLFGLALALLALVTAARAETRIGVIYPESSPPYTRLYQKIIDGMNGGDVRITVRVVAKTESPEDIRNWMTASQNQAAITLGELPAQLHAPLAALGPLVIGATPLPDATASGVSLSASPAQLFRRLRLVKPGIERIFVVYKPQASSWLVSAGRAAARDLGIDFQAIACDDIQQASAAVARIFQDTRPGKDAIWLTLDPVLPINQILPVLLKEAWDKQVALVSNNPLDVARGVLFALYPDYTGMGRQLVDRTKRQLARTAPPGPEPAEYLLGAFNTRTAAHLGITLTEPQRRSFERLFPEGQE